MEAYYYQSPRKSILRSMVPSLNKALRSCTCRIPQTFCKLRGGRSSPARVYATNEPREPTYRRLLGNSIDEFFELATSTFIGEVPYFVGQALMHRKKGGRQTSRQRASSFREILEEFLIGDEATMRLDFLSQATRYSLVHHYLALPFELLPPIPLSERGYQPFHTDDQAYEMTGEHTLPEVFDEAIIEALEYAKSTFNHHGICTDCIARLKQQIVPA
mmetsp:Transcript_1091/g.1754  ORF Transcript_1091/g.1754 Transcript_1091/m.1754 type:complete len:217 (-) Transcript_1091:517-1167(-)